VAGSQSDWRASFREAGPYLGLGMQIAASMAFFVGAGYFLDSWLGTFPWLMVAGAFVGMAAVIIHLVRISKQMSADFNDGDRFRQPSLRERPTEPPRAKSPPSYTPPDEWEEGRSKRRK
jgi:hypothetical protein